jgi:uncharacterized protein
MLPCTVLNSENVATEADACVTNGKVFFMVNHARLAVKNLYENYHIRQYKMPSKTRARYMCGPLTAASPVSVELCGNLQIREEHTRLPEGSLKAPLRILQLSDVHLDWNTRDWLWQVQPVLHHVVQAHAIDAIFMTGDYIAHGSGYFEELRDWCQALPHVAHRYAVLGNHDYYEASHGQDALRTLEASGFYVLHNQHHRMECGPARGHIHLHGLDDYVKGEPQPQPLLEFAKTHAEETHILLVHNPAQLNEPLPWGVFDVALAGHTHGGQIFCPEWMASIISESPYVRDWYQVDGNCQLFVHQGTGTASIPFPFRWPPFIRRRFPMTLPRWGMTSEIVIHTLVPEALLKAAWPASC